MNARQKAKKYKKKINTLEFDNDLMRRIIADCPTMQELYDAYNKPVFVTQATIQFQEYRSKRFLSQDDMFDAVMITMVKQALTRDLLETIKNNITYELDTEGIAPTITASIIIGRS